MRKIVSSIDIGSANIKIVVGEMIKNKLNILAVSEAPSVGIKKGKIVDEISFKKSLKKGLQKVEESLGVEVRKTIINVPADDLKFNVTEGITTITNEQHLIAGNDIARALQGCVYNKVKANEELISIMPIYFVVDDLKKVKDPKGIIANKLSAKSLIITTPKYNVYPLLECLDSMGIEVIDITLTVIGDYFAAEHSNLDNDIGVIVDMGYDLTTIALFNKGILTNVQTLPLGGRNIDNDISFIYKIDKKRASHIKEKLGLAHNRFAQANEIQKTNNDLNEEIKINQYELSQIIMSRIDEILKMVKEEINHLTNKEISYIIFTGGVSESLDFSLALESVFSKSARVLHMQEIGARDNRYSSCVGMIKYFVDKMNFRNKEYSIFNLEQQEELGSYQRRVNLSDNSVLGKLFGYFFDN